MKTLPDNFLASCLANLYWLFRHRLLMFLLDSPFCQKVRNVGGHANSVWEMLSGGLENKGSCVHVYHIVFSNLQKYGKRNHAIHLVEHFTCADYALIEVVDDFWKLMTLSVLGQSLLSLSLSEQSMSSQFYLFLYLSALYSRTSAHQKKASGPIIDGCEPPWGCCELNSGLEVQVVVGCVTRVLGSKLGSSGKAASTIKCWAISLNIFYKSLWNTLWVLNFIF